ncbi:MAG: hypothetical protein KatS3mg085_084 [Candidatus Dojkabacteria bacterium]|nr:MAG: hypothetical protein KatS3mg085_084 [Candidatus Dojkabacteria bacterium]
MRFFLITILWLVLVFPVFAQEVVFELKDENLNGSGEVIFEVVFESASVTNAIDLDISVNGDFESLEFIKNKNSKLFYLPSQCGENFVVDGRICVSIVSTSGSFDDRQVLGEIHLISNEAKNLSFNVNDNTKIVINENEILLNSLQNYKDEELEDDSNFEIVVPSYVEDENFNNNYSETQKPYQSSELYNPNFELTLVLSVSFLVSFVSGILILKYK